MIDIGLYRHFKGDYYFVDDIVEDCTRDVLCCRYVNVLRPDLGWFVRPCSEWYDTHTSSGEIIDRPDNVTGQSTRFVKVKSLDNVVSDASTEQLLDELSHREDSPLQELDIEGLNAKVFVTDYCIGKGYEARDSYPKGVRTELSFTTLEEAVTFYERHISPGFSIFKRTFIEVR